MRFTIPKPSSRSEWLEKRRPYVGASEAACLIDRHPYLNLATYAVNKIKGTDVPETKAMRRGSTLEAGVARLWEDENGISVVPATVLYGNGPFLATPDYESANFDAPWGLEIKTTALYIDEPLDSWKIQCIVQAHCAGWDSVELAVLDRTMALKCFTIDATTEEAGFLMVTLTEAAERFLGYVREGKVPEGLELNEWAVKALYPRAAVKTVDVDAETLSWVNELAEARELKAAAEKRESAAKDALAAVMVDANSARYGEATVLTWRNDRDGLMFDRSLFEAEHPGVLGLMEEPRYKRPAPGARKMLVTKAGKDAAAEMPWAAKEESF